MGTTTVVRSIQGKKKTPIEHLKCRARRHAFDGPMLRERFRGRVCWVERLECERCGALRVDVRVPRTCELIWRDYDHPENYPGDMSPQEARRQLFKLMLAEQAAAS